MKAEHPIWPPWEKNGDKKERMGLKETKISISSNQRYTWLSPTQHNNNINLKTAPIYPTIYQKMNEIEIDEGFEVEASPTFFGSGGGGGLVEEEDDDIDIEQLPQQDDESTMNDESTIAAASSYISRGYSYVASNTKWVIVVMAAAFVVFFSIGVGLGYGPIGNSIYGNNDDASSVSSAMAVDFTASDSADHGSKSSKSGGGAKSGKAKSDSRQV